MEKTAVRLAAVAPAHDEGGVWLPPKDLVQCGTVVGVTDSALDVKPDETDARYGRRLFSDVMSNDLEVVGHAVAHPVGPRRVNNQVVASSRRVRLRRDSCQ